MANARVWGRAPGSWGFGARMSSAEEGVALASDLGASEESCAPLHRALGGDQAWGRSDVSCWTDWAGGRFSHFPRRWNTIPDTRDFKEECILAQVCHSWLVPSVAEGRGSRHGRQEGD